MRSKATVRTCNKAERKRERGAALVMVLFASLIILAGALMLMLTTTISATNAISSTDEMQAYYAAEAGLQDALNVLRGNVAPNPNDGTKMNFKNAINSATSNNPTSDTVAKLSRWLVYEYPTNDPRRVILSPKPYSETDGIAYGITGIVDPDNSREVVYTTGGAFNGNSISTSASSLSLGGGVSLNYTPQASTNITTNFNPALGTIAISGVKPSTNFTFSTQTFTLQITEAGPLPVGSTVPVSASIKGTFAGTINATTSVVSLTFPNQTIEIPGVGTLFTMPSQTIQIPANGTVTTLQTTVNAPEPARLVVKVTGYGPHGATKNLQMMVTRFGLDYDPPATFVVRGAGNDSTTASTIAIGSSANYVYSGIDNAGGQPLPAFMVTTTPDYTNLSTLKSNNPNALEGDPTGFIPNLQQVTMPSGVAALPKWLQTTSDPVFGARAFVNKLRTASQQQFYGCSSGTAASCDRYFNTAAGDAAPTDFGAGTTDGLFTFVDGDVSLPSAGGKGLLVVTGTLSMNGSQTFDGLVLVLGGGVLDRSGGGNGTSLGAFVVAKFNGTGDFLAPTFTSSGSGTSWLKLDRNKVKTALRLGGVPVVSVSEF
ncbi:MAG TPA: pilus assembly PilX N-terminal domain-containing protein [Pyrinomonadaceae bacterium]|nr:pilus assembly PilX N-terminal domain-containing protein [Pyrinomonadaceae bacterium]